MFYFDVNNFFSKTYPSMKRSYLLGFYCATGSFEFPRFEEPELHVLHEANGCVEKIPS